MKATILLVDDESIIRKMMSIGLKQFGYNVIEAGGGEQALRLYKENDIDLVVLDILMPGMCGRKCFSRLIEYDRRAKVIAFTGVRRSSLEEIGFLDIITKPAPLSVFIEQIRAGIAAAAPEDFFS